MPLLSLLRSLRSRKANEQHGKWKDLAAEKEAINKEINRRLHDIEMVRGGWEAAGMTKEEANAKIKGLGIEIDQLRAKKPLEYGGY